MMHNTIAKYEKYWSMVHGIRDVAVVFDSRYKFALLEFSYDEIFGANVEEETNKICALCYKLLNGYELKEKMVSRSGKTIHLTPHSQTTQVGHRG